jgi:hypothetical protein
MATGQAVADLLEETITALSLLDVASLQALEERAAVLAQSNLVTDAAGMDLIRAKRRVLEVVLGHSESNLNALNRLYGRDTRGPWQL